MFVIYSVLSLLPLFGVVMVKIDTPEDKPLTKQARAIRRARYHPRHARRKETWIWHQTQLPTLMTLTLSSQQR